MKKASLTILGLTGLCYGALLWFLGISEGNVMQIFFGPSVMMAGGVALSEAAQIR